MDSGNLAFTVKRPPPCAAPAAGTSTCALTETTDSRAYGSFLPRREVITGVERGAKAFLALVALIGWVAFLHGAATWESTGLSRYGLYLFIFLVASCLKVRLPGITGYISVNYIFIFLALLELSLPETLVMAAAGTVLQLCWRARSWPSARHVALQVGIIMVAVACTYRLLHHPLMGGTFEDSIGLRLALVGCAYYLLSTFPVAAMIAFNEGQAPALVWRRCYVWSFSYYLFGAALAGAIFILNRNMGYQTTMLALPALYLVYKSYRLHLDRLEGETVHASEMSRIHLRTVEALAAAIEAKDSDTREHLERVQVYAVEMSKAAGLSEERVQAVRAAAILHDIGKLAVPEHILSKPGRLTREEFEKVKTHTVIGAEIVERIQFPYPVAPIVRHHHELWNGQGYPDGLRGEEIPIGARILAIADSLDALASDRPYHRAMPLEDAVQEIVLQSGVRFDPRLVEILVGNVTAWDTMAKATICAAAQTARPGTVREGSAPAAGLHCSEEPIANVTGMTPAEADTVREIRRLLSGPVLKVTEVMPQFEIVIGRLVRFETLVLYRRSGLHVAPFYVSGQDTRYFRRLRIPVGEGLAGWVARIGKPILNGNPVVEAGYLNAGEQYTILRCALAVPVPDAGETAWVLAVYSTGRESFANRDLRLLQVVAADLGVALRQIEPATAADDLTGLLEASRSGALAPAPPNLTVPKERMR